MGSDGGSIIGRILAGRGVRQLFTLCGGHISPILVGAEANGIRVVDVRDEVSAVFAADAVARMTGIPGVAAVTAGPGVTNTITAIKNAQMAQSPLLLFGGAAATLLKGRGSLQDIDQISVMRGRLGAFERNTLQTTLRSTQIALENLTASESSIRDTDFAEETANLTRGQILSQAGISTLAIANQNPSQVLSLLG